MLSRSRACTAPIQTTGHAIGMNISRDRGILAALGAALLFGASTPAAKLLLGPVSPWLLAGLLYLGSGLGLALFRQLRRSEPVRLAQAEIKWLIAAIVAGGMVGPALLMWGLSGMPASGASLLLNAEGVFTALLAWFVFRENFDRHSTYRRLFLDRPVCRHADCRHFSGRDGDDSAPGSRRIDGLGRMAAPYRAARARAHARGDGTRTRAYARSAPPA